MPYDRLDKDIELMKRAGITVVRVGESTWTSWEPRDGEFQFAWMDRICDKMHAAGIKVVMGTPTYSIPPWLYAKHPEVMVVPLGQVAHAARVLRHPAEHGHHAPGVPAGPPSASSARSPSATRSTRRSSAGRSTTKPAPTARPGRTCRPGFKEWLKRRFGTVEKMNEAWGLVYWGQLVDSWDHLPPRDGIINPGWKLEWERYSRSLVTDFLAWQARIVREYVPPTQWVTQDFHGGLRSAVDSWDIAKFLDVAAINPYHDTQDGLDGWWIAFIGDFTRSLKHAPYLVTETNAQAIGWDARGQFPPYDGQLRLQAWANVASGAHMVEYWHWHSLHYGQETYWKGLLGHDLEPNRVYEEATRIGAEFKRIGPQLAGMTTKNRVAILHSADSHFGLQFMPIGTDTRDERGRPKTDYLSIQDQLHKALYAMNVGADFVFAEEPDFTGYDVLLVPPLYVASDALLEKIAVVREVGRPRAADAQERVHQRMGHRALDARARAAARGRRRLVPGVLEPEGAAVAEGRPVRRGRGTEQGVDVGRHASAGDGEAAGGLRPPVLRPLSRHHAQRVRQGHGHVPGHVLTRLPCRTKVVADVLKQAGVTPDVAAGEGARPPRDRARRQGIALPPELLERNAVGGLRKRLGHRPAHGQVNCREAAHRDRSMGPARRQGIGRRDGRATARRRAPTRGRRGPMAATPYAASVATGE